MVAIESGFRPAEGEKGAVTTLVVSVPGAVRGAGGRWAVVATGWRHCDLLVTVVVKGTSWAARIRYCAHLPLTVVPRPTLNEPT